MQCLSKISSTNSRNHQKNTIQDFFSRVRIHSSPIHSPIHSRMFSGPILSPWRFWRVACCPRCYAWDPTVTSRDVTGHDSNFSYQLKIVAIVITRDSFVRFCGSMWLHSPHVAIGDFQCESSAPIGCCHWSQDQATSGAPHLNDGLALGKGKHMKTLMWAKLNVLNHPPVITMFMVFECFGTIPSHRWFMNVYDITHITVMCQSFLVISSSDNPTPLASVCFSFAASACWWWNRSVDWWICVVWNGHTNTPRYQISWYIWLNHRISENIMGSDFFLFFFFVLFLDFFFVFRFG